ncbi:MAG: multidrug ABC transporter permease [Nitrosomonas sp.]|nr:MAG: multidrug ABC transporter permease [Nitrosomonas sp.]
MMMRLLKPFFTLLMFLIVLAFVHTILAITATLPAWLGLGLSILCAATAARFAWQLAAGARPSVYLAISGGALILGALCFTAGFWGLMIFAKETNQAPLIGIFIAAPLGLIVGAIGGYRYASGQAEH